MYTANKINVADLDDASLVKTMSGGVSEPSDPRHFPELGNSASSPRAMSRLRDSFKEKLLTESGDESGNSGHAGASGSEAAKVDKAAENTSPKIAAGRDSSGEAVNNGLNEERGSSRMAVHQEDARPAGIQGRSEGESWEPVSPRKHISQRRRTADELAERAAKEGTIFDIPGHPNTFGALADSEENAHEVSPDERDSDELASEGLDEASRWTGPSVGGGVWERVEAGIHWVQENPMKVATVVGMTMGALFLMRRRRF